jgi:hypothetical protein
MKSSKVSLCITCMGRLHHLIRTFPENLRSNKEFNVEFVILDYNSGDGLKDWIRDHFMPEIHAGRLVYARTDAPSGFHHAHAKNLAHRIASGDILCNLDADNYATEDFTKYLLQNFAERDMIIMRGHSISGYNGRIALGKFWFYRIGGYDEELLPGHGNEDADLYGRACDIGLSSILLPKEHGKVIHHSNEERQLHLINKDPNVCRMNAELSARNRKQGLLTANTQSGWCNGEVQVNFGSKYSTSLPPRDSVLLKGENGRTMNISPCLVTVAFRPNKYFDDFIQSCRANHIKPYVLGMGELYKGNANRLTLLKRFIEGDGAWFSHILFCGADAVIITNTLQIIFQRFQAFGCPIVFSAEAYCWPDQSCAERYPAAYTRYRYLNSSVWLGETIAVREMLSKIDTDNLDASSCDQNIFTRVFLEKFAPIKLDHTCTIAQSLNGALNDIQVEEEWLATIKSDR